MIFVALASHARLFVVPGSVPTTLRPLESPRSTGFLPVQSPEFTGAPASYMPAPPVLAFSQDGSAVQEEPLRAPSIGSTPGPGLALAVAALALGASRIAALSHRGRSIEFLEKSHQIRRAAEAFSRQIRAEPQEPRDATGPAGCRGCPGCPKSRGSLAASGPAAPQAAPEAFYWPTSYGSQTPRKGRATKPRMDMGFQVDPLASATSLSIMMGFVWGYLNMLDFSKKRARRDSDAQLLQNAKVMVLTGKLDADTYERAVADAERSRREFEATRTLSGIFVSSPVQPRQPQVRASLSPRSNQRGEQDGQDELLQDFKDHYSKMLDEDGSSSSR